MTTPLQYEAAVRYPWLRAAYHQASIVRQALADQEVAADPQAAAGPEDRLDRPDVMLGGRFPVDVVPDTDVSRSAHLARGYVNESQLMTYEVPSREFLAQIFQVEGS
ncbi:hypothetical protein BIV57_02060 [Mangrovactinospora gilvigrisea]|uniref:Uncharacterized protein n=1 Tax=Mangrovactinospora gilvigrisea TaxID=1428644 RepID=A0A1J7CHM2_9ACTN|nr:hypothetical protein [Mangrovactinospora gilvigrisea]OIV39138.1 hypothetical protein BIV57_02060 [Mangrovactinospora gilvigrisea]